MGLINRDALLAKDTLKIEKVMIDENNYVFVREMTGKERDTFEQSLLKKEGNDYVEDLTDFRAKLAVCTICNEKGDLLLNSNDYKTLSKNKKVAFLDKVVEVAQKLNAINKEALEDKVKN